MSTEKMTTYRHELTASNMLASNNEHTFTHRDRHNTRMSIEFDYAVAAAIHSASHPELQFILYGEMDMPK